MSEPNIEKKSSQFSEKIDALSNLISDASSKVQKKEGNYPVSLIIGCLIPFLIFGGLFFGKPSFVKNTEGERDKKKVFYWTTLFTFVIWVMMYIGIYYSGNYSSINKI